ncbi:band 3 anion transport protein-like isoform X2 [Symsagittifera roscoffensis]|uniref:band 3 anion transport protein-like isoform X2 n=1 Tax=Symsagittifera roscoffensis TaxID=84072 RepID=UPI00307C8E27
MGEVFNGNGSSHDTPPGNFIENPLSEIRDRKPASISTLATDTPDPLKSSTPTADVTKLPKFSSDITKSFAETPIDHSVLNKGDGSPRSKDVDAMTDLLMGSREPAASLSLSEEMSANVAIPTPTESFAINREDIEGHKNSLFHSHLPLQSAHKKRRSSSSAKATSGTSKGVNRMKKRSLQQASPNSDLPDSARRSQDDDDSVSYGRSSSVPATSSLGDTPRVVQFATESVLKPISEENVKFSLGSDVGVYESGDDDQAATPLRSRKTSRHHAAMLQLGLPDRPLSDNLSKRQIPGDKVLQQTNTPSSVPSDVHLQMKDDFELPEVDLDRGKSHRLDYQRPMHKFARPSSSPSFHGVSFAEGVDQVQRVPFDHTAHDVFVELDELMMGDDGFQWKEKARWIKYEEDVELGGEWGKPHVSTLSFHSLLELRRLLEHGVALFDLEENSMDGIVTSICMLLKDRGLLGESECKKMEKVLMGRHSHQGGGVKRTFSHAGFNTPTTSKKHSSFIQIDQGDKTNGVNNGSSDYRRTQSTPVHAANETLQSVEVDNGKLKDHKDSKVEFSPSVDMIKLRHKSDSDAAALSSLDFEENERARGSEMEPFLHFASSDLGGGPQGSRNPDEKFYFPSVESLCDETENRSCSSLSIESVVDSGELRNEEDSQHSKDVLVGISRDCTEDEKADKSATGEGPSMSFLAAAASRKQSVFSNLMALGGGGGNERGSNPQMTDIEKRLPEGAEVANVWVGSVSFLKSPIMLFVRLAEGVIMSEVSEVRMPMRFIFILMGPVTKHLFMEDYHEIGRAMSTLMSYKDFREACYVANDPKDLVTPMNAFLDGSVVVPAHGWNKGNVTKMLQDIKAKMIEVDHQRKRKKKMGERRDSRTLKKGEEGDDDELRRSKRCLGGLIQDVKRRYPLYLSDITDALNFQCFSVVIFIFFAVLTPSITFGADVELDRVNSWMGVYETILGSAIAGALFGLLSGQPLLIIGCTGPLAVFEGSLYDVTESVSEKNYMPFRCWVGLWLFLICALTAVLELSFVLKYFTRFTEEIFAMLVSLIFCVSVIRNLIKIFEDHPLGINEDCQVPYVLNQSYVDQCVVVEPTSAAICSNQSSIFGPFTPDEDYCCNEPGSSSSTPNTALLSLILTGGCFIIAYFLKQFRSSPFLGPRVRKALGDFGVPIAILLMTGLDMILNDKIYTKKLNFPESFEPTKNEDKTNFTRNWVISPFDLEKEYWWMALAAFVPAVLVFFLMFIEIQITARILNKKEHNLQKGTGYHLNILVIGLSGIICGVLGCPFVTGATIRSVSHTSALIVSDPHHAPGEKPKMSVIEQRVTSFLVNVLLGLSILLKSVLSHVPYSVLYGVFFYMGVACLGSLQFYDRIKLMFMQRRNYPSVPYVRNVSGLKVHLFTIIQIAVVAILWAVKESPISIFFPFFLILLVPVRLKLLPKFYTEVELAALDSEEVDGAVEQDDFDYNVTAHMPY